MLAPFECLCGNFILPEPVSYVFFYAVFNLRNLLYLIVRQAKGLPPASFRFHLAMDTFAFGYALPATGRAWDFHPLDFAHAGRTKLKEGLLFEQAFF